MTFKTGIVIVVFLALTFLLYRSSALHRSLNINPQAHQEIEKAKQR